ncbi:Sporulation protein YtfJ [anaerobic digester metagenome]
MDIGDPIKTTVDELRKVMNIENVIGEVIETEDKVLIPITKMGMAFGAGMGGNKTKSGSEEGQGAASGGGAKIEPIAMVVVFKGVEGPEGVRLLSLRSQDPLATVISEVGTAAVEIMGQGSKMMKNKGKKHHHEKMEEESEEPEPSKTE